MDFDLDYCCSVDVESGLHVGKLQIVISSDDKVKMFLVMKAKLFLKF